MKQRSSLPVAVSVSKALSVVWEGGCGGRCLHPGVSQQAEGLEEQRWDEGSSSGMPQESSPETGWQEQERVTACLLQPSVIEKDWHQPRCPSVEKYLNPPWYVCTRWGPEQLPEGIKRIFPWSAVQ
jgi:hypothetical protein